MRDEVFESPVTIELGAGGRRQVVARPSQAAQLLSERWPQENRGPKYRAALQACTGVMAQRMAVDDARKAFIEAAREARILVPEHKAVVFGRRGKA